MTKIPSPKDVSSTQLLELAAFRKRVAKTLWEGERYVDMVLSPETDIALLLQECEQAGWAVAHKQQKQSSIYPNGGILHTLVFSEPVAPSSEPQPKVIEDILLKMIDGEWSWFVYKGDFKLELPGGLSSRREQVAWLMSNRNLGYLKGLILEIAPTFASRFEKPV